MSNNKLNARLLVAAAMVVVLNLVVGSRLFGLQVLSDPPAQAAHFREKLFKHTVAIPAARGEILDRYGRPLVKNKLFYNITIDRGYLRSGGVPAETIKALLHIANETETSYVDTLPITPKPPFLFTKMDETVQKQLEHYLQKKEWRVDIAPGKSAEGFLDLFYADIGIADKQDRRTSYRYSWSAEERRAVAGVLYEVEMRYFAALADKREGQTYFHVPPYVFATDVNEECIAAAEEQRLRGVIVQPETERVIQTGSAAHILGRVGKIQPQKLEEFREKGYADDAVVGIDGVERAFEDRLHGTAGKQIITTDENGYIRDIQTVKPIAGQNIYLTIDIQLQAAMERILEEGVLELQRTGTEKKGKEAEAAAAVIVDVGTSEVLAAANYPTFDLRNFSEDYKTLLDDPLKPLFNRAVAGTYSPGSTFKMVTATAALESGVIARDETILDRGKYTFYTAPQPKCWVYPSTHGYENVRAALRDSCNYYFYEVGRRMGIETIENWARKYGLGEPTGIELGDERIGLVAGPSTAQKLGIPWFGGNTLSAAIGQSDNQFTPLQLANYVAAVANGGHLHSASLLLEADAHDYGQTLFLRSTQSLGEVGVSSANISAVQEGMYAVTHDGGTAASPFRSCAFETAGKTGSVQIGDRPNNGVFVAYAPYDAPKVSVSVVVEKGGAGGVIAPLARKVLETYFDMERGLSENPPENGLLN